MARTQSVYARTTVEVWGTRNSWSLVLQDGHPKAATKCLVELEIQGNDKDGYHLVMSPEGFFTADYWYETKAEALQSASALFEVPEDAWSNEKPGSH